MNILSIQSEVVYGHVGNSAARFALERLGHEIWALPTVLLSSHAGYSGVAGDVVAADLLRRLVGGLGANGWLERCDAVLSGYLGHAEQALVVADAVRMIKAASPRAIFCLDPVFGDAGRPYARPGVAEAMARHLLPLADLVTPNAFELSNLASLPINSAADACEAARRLGKPLVLASSVPAEPAHIATLAVARDEAWLCTTPRLESPPHGSGDLMAALFLGRSLMGQSPPDALALSTASVFHILSESVAAGSREMLLIQNQDALVTPPASTEIRLERVA